MEGVEGSLVSLEGSGGEEEGHRVEEAHRRSAPCGTEGRHPAQHGEQKEKRHEIDKLFKVRRMGGGGKGVGTRNDEWCGWGWGTTNGTEGNAVAASCPSPPKRGVSASPCTAHRTAAGNGERLKKEKE